MHDQARNATRPTTPTAPSRPPQPTRALAAHPASHRPFFDDAMPGERPQAADAYDDLLRDSHDLSFAEGATVRDSVVDNMLLSLDQFATGHLFGGSAPAHPSYGEAAFFLRDNSYRPPGNRHRGHTHSSSPSRDYDAHPDDPARYAAHPSRARRSTSSNPMGTPASRRGSPRDGLAGRQQNGPCAPPQHRGHLRGAGDKGSRSSASSSMDGMLGTQRLGFGTRSASFDHGGASEGSRNAPVKVESVLERGRVAYQNYPGEYDAAPEPTIPAGPRRIHEQPQSPATLYPTQPPFAPPTAHGRKNSLRSNTSYRTVRKGKSQVDASMRAQAQEFVNASTLRDLPAVPSFQDPPAPSPTVSTRKPFAFQAPAATPQQKPGFFRRVFGGSAKTSPPPSNATNSANSTVLDSTATSTEQRAPDVDSILSQARPRTTPSNNSHVAPHLKALPRAPQTASPHRDTQLPPPSLAKKPSSFFRRRKKSMSENVPPPIMTLDFSPPANAVLPAQLSPGASSLRQVMDPYLGRDAQEKQSADEDTGGDGARGFSPGHQPHQDATVRTVKTKARGRDETPPAPRGERAKAGPPTAADGAKLKLKLKHGKSARASQLEDAFVAESSSSRHDRSGRPSPSEVWKPGAGPASTEAGPDGSSNGNTYAGPRADLLSPHDPVHSRRGSMSPSASEAEDEGWVLTAQRTTPLTDRHASAGAKRVWLDTTLPDDKCGDASNGRPLPLHGAPSSQQLLDKPSPALQGDSPTWPHDVFHSATSLPIVQVESRGSDTMPSIVEDHAMHTAPTDSDRARALQIYSGSDSAVLKADAAALLGDIALSSMRMRKAFMDLFDWTGFTILAAMRDLCGKIVLKAETQQVDRILMSLSERWCECNSSHGFRAVDVVHTICYSILLLNTDLHMADIESRMTRSQFVKNTLPTVTRVCKDAVKAEGGETLRPQSTHFRRPSLPWNDKPEPTSPGPETTVFPADVPEEPTEKRARSRLSIRPAVKSGSEGILSFDSATGESNTLVNTPYNGPMRGWEIQVETVLKEFYDSIRKQRLPLHGVSNLAVQHQSSNNNLSVSGMLRRTPSVLSKTPSDNASYRSRQQGDFRSVGGRWASKNRSKQKLYPSSTVASSRTSLDDVSVWSPTGSSTWSRYSYGKTGTSMSVDSLGSHFAAGDYQQAIGFANALSQAIIREEGMTIASDEEFSRVAPLLEDETLELVGAPWAKEGILKHKHHLESSDKKAKDRAWSECFAVVEKGYMRLFSFSINSKSVRNKSKLRPSVGGVVGGGNWMDNAEALESFPLRQTIASALPPPGYSKSRPYVFALSLPTGAVHLFHVGTPDIAREFVCTANYWSARLSKEPLMGGVSSMEYGWGDTVINPALIRPDSTPSVQGHMPRPSVTSSLRSSIDHASGTLKPRLPGDKVVLSDWSPPTSSMMASNLMEVDQLRALTDYVKNIESDLAHHNELRAPLLIAFSPRHPNAVRAMANWERKSQYLLREIVKFRTYIDTLTMAQTQKQKIYAEREAREEELATAEGADGLKATGEDGAKEAPNASNPTSQKPTAKPSLPQSFLHLP